MRILLDTHMIIWSLLGDSRLSQNSISLINDKRNELFFSVASLWEIEIKHGLHPDSFPSAQMIEMFCKRAGFKQIVVDTPEVFELNGLQYQGKNNHKDPFDRILISQAKAYGMVLLTSDSKLDGYCEKCILRG